jgi:hypothetical protein
MVVGLIVGRILLLLSSICGYWFVGYLVCFGCISEELFSEIVVIACLNFFLETLAVYPVWVVGVL